MSKKVLYNTTDRDLRLPNGVTVRSMSSVGIESDKWDKVKDNVVVKAWLDAKAITLGGKSGDDAESEEGTAQGNGFAENADADGVNAADNGENGTEGSNGPSEAELEARRAELSKMTNAELSRHIVAKGGTVKKGADKDELIEAALAL